MAYKFSKRKLHSAALSFGLAATLLFQPIGGILGAADSVSANKSKQDELKRQNDELNGKLSELKGSTDEQREYVDTLKAQISTVQQQIDIINERIFTLDKRITELTDEIAEKDERIAKNIVLLKKRIKALYLAGETSTLDIILGAKDFGDLLDKASIMKAIAKHDDALINQLKSDMESIKVERETIEQDKITVAEEKKNLDAKKDELESLYDESSSVLSKLEGEQAKLLDQMDENNAEMQKIQAEIEAYYEQQRRAAEEAERQRRAKANAAATPSANATEPSEPSSSEAPSTSPTGSYTWPVPGYYYISSDFYDSAGRSSHHGAIDIAGSGIYGAPVVAADGGTVITACSDGWGGGYGNYVVIDHGNGRSTLYGHMSRVVVSSGQRVSKGETIGYVGSTGYSTGPHLHFETRNYGTRYNPMSEF